ncbi:hypothetical protein J7K70_00110 [bacterium]|nr:hypothetical protein [bacterium]
MGEAPPEKFVEEIPKAKIFLDSGLPPVQGGQEDQPLMFWRVVEEIKRVQNIEVSLRVKLTKEKQNG